MALCCGQVFPNISKEQVPSSSVCSGPRRIAVCKDEMHCVGVGGERTEWPASGGASVLQ
jgi:hypothetical protein